MEGIQTFKTFLSPTLNAEFDKIVGGDNARRQARQEADPIRVKPPAANNGQPAAQSGVDGLVQALSDLINQPVTQPPSQLPRAQGSAADVQASTAEYKKGRALLEAKDYARAIEHLKKSNSIVPSGAAYMDLGIAYSRLKQYPEAIEAYKQVIRMVPNNAEVHLRLATAYQGQGSELALGPSHSKDLKPFENAEAEAREALRLKPGDYDAYFMLGNATFVQRRYPEALTAFQQAIRLKPDDQASLYLLSLSYAKLGKKDEAMGVYRKLAALDKDYAQKLLTEINKPVAVNSPVASTAPGTAAYFSNEGQKYYDAKEYAKAVESFQKAITLKPDVPTLASTHAWLGSSYRELKQYPNAIAALKESLRLRPNDANTTFGLGWTYHLADQYQNALATLQEAVRLNPKDAETQYWIGEVYFFGLKQPENGLKAYRESLRLRPDDARTLNETGLAYYELDQFSEAVDAYKEAIRLKPSVGVYHSNLGLAYVEMGMKEQAIAVQQTLQKIDSARAKGLAEQIDATFPSDKDDPEYLLGYANITSDMGYPEAALPVYRRVLLLKPEPSTAAAVYRMMGDVFKELKKGAKATAAYQQALMMYQRLLQAKPQEAYLQYGLGHTFLGLGQKEQAMQVYRKLATIDKKVAQDLLDEIKKSQ